MSRERVLKYSAYIFFCEFALEREDNTMRDSHEIAIIISDYRGSLTEDFVIGIQTMANRCGYATTTFSMLQKSNLFTNNEESVYNLIDYKRYEGIIIVTQSFTHKELATRLTEKLRENYSGPVLSIGNSPVFPSIATSNSSKITEDLIDHLMDIHMCRDILVLGGERFIKSSKFTGIRNSFEKHNVPLKESRFLYGGYWTDCAENLATSIADQRIPKPDAVVCISDTVANALIQKLYHYGFRVPEDIIIASCDYMPSEQSKVLSLTTIDSDPKYLGEAAFHALYEKITGRTDLVLRERENTIMLGMSCGCGNMKQGNIRFHLSQEAKHKKSVMEYNNSKLEEKLYSIKKFSELPYYIRNLSYLILDREILGLSLVDKDFNKADCLFLSGYLENGNKLSFTASDIYPKLFQDRALLNTNVLPLIFNESFYGFVTIASRETCVYGEMTKDFVQKVSVALTLMRERNLLEPHDSALSRSPYDYIPEKETPPAPAPSHTDSDGTIFAIKNDVMYKVNVANAVYFETRDKRTFITLSNGSYPVRKPLYEIEEAYRSKGFLRISKSVVVNMACVLRVTVCEDRTLLATLSNKENVRVSRQYVKDFKKNLAI